MIICITDKCGLVHIVDFGNGNKYWSVCGKAISKTDNVNIFAADAPIRTGCSNCHKYYDSVYLEDLNLSPNTVRSTLSNYIDELYSWIQREVLIPEFKYSNDIDRESRAIGKLKRKYESRANKYVPSSKRK